MAATPQDVTGFWRTAGPEKWFAGNHRFDDAIRLKFEPVHHRAARGEYDGWAASAEGSLALLILLDQFPRNLYRGSAHAFATDPKARQVARAAVGAAHDRAVDPELRQFFYMPFEHSEDLADQDEAVRLFAILKDETGNAELLKWAELHRDIIVRFGRFPHRNPLLGRLTTPNEQAFLDEGGFAG
jgi:uncharacterized protein (DUF924 family)